MRLKKGWHRAGVLAFAAWMGLLAGCGTAEERPAAETPPPSAAQASASAPATASPDAVTGDAAPSPSPSRSAAPPAPDISPAAAVPASPAAAPSPSAGNAPKDTPAERPRASAPSAPDARERIVAITVLGNAEWGTIVDGEQTELREGDTVADLLIRVLKGRKLAYDTSGKGAFFYVKGIDGLFEFDDGPTSGWTYRVNGKAPGISAGTYEPKPGDRIEWYYSEKEENSAGLPQEEAGSP